jgi:radical SAM superfamily enzyme YgiQ (UPF0313 family)
MATKVYLADLRYNYSGVLANDCMPLGVAYMKAVMDRDLPDVTSRLFAYPSRLYDALLQDTPDVLMVSNYTWNEALSFHLAKLAKKIRPEMLVVMGGPNISLEPERQREYFSNHPEIDLYVLGEGDFLAREVVKHFLDAGGSIRAMGDREIPSSIYRRSDGTVVRSESWARHKEVDEIPSPWLTGIQDEFFDGVLAPMIETNRGCPFTCTFCVQGTSWYTKVHNFEIERIKEEIGYIARKINELCPSMGTLRIADSNYGMFERDIEISAHLGKMQKEHGWPNYIDATTGKNRADRIVKSVEKVGGALVVYQAVQSLDETVLKNVKRANIKLEAYSQLLMYIRGRGLRSNSDLILGLPGETLSSHVSSIHKLLDGGASQVTNFQLLMLKGSELETRASRDEFKFETRFRIGPKNFGMYGNETVMDVEEVVVATDTMSFEDYLEARKYALVSAAYWHDSLLDDVLVFCEKSGVKRSQWLDAVLSLMESDQGVVRKYLDNFVRETTNELFPTREACVRSYSQEDAFARLLRGEVGDNLMHKYRAIAGFHLWPEIFQVGMNAAKQLLVSGGIAANIPDFEEFWQAFSQHVLMAHAHGRTIDEVLTPARASMVYDIHRWLADEAPLDPSPYRLDEPQEFEFRCTETGARELRKAFDVWTADIKGLSKLVTRIQVAWQVRKSVPVLKHMATAGA